MQVKVLSKTHYASFYFVASTSLFAQVKFRTNLNTIEAASNLEVGASTADRKVNVNQTTGQVSIADGTQRAAKILTFDANGEASWQAPLP